MDSKENGQAKLKDIDSTPRGVDESLSQEASIKAIPQSEDGAGLAMPLADGAGQEQRDIIKASTQRIDNISSGVTKIEGTIFNPRKNKNLYSRKQEKVDFDAKMCVGYYKGKEINSLVDLDFDGMKKKGVSIPNENWIVPFDREVHSAIASLFKAGNECMTPQMIFQVLSGNSKTAKMTPQMRETIIESVSKLRLTEVKIHAQEENAVGWSSKSVYEGVLIPSERIECILLNGQRVADCIHILRTPPLYEYADNKDQISRVDIRMLNAPVNNTPGNIELKGYLAREISSMKSGRSNITPVIRYSTLYEYLRIESTSEKAQKTLKLRVRETVKSILTAWKESGYIKDFHEEKEKRTIAKIVIEL